MKNISLSSHILGGGYVPGESYLHQTGTGAKILLTLTMLAGAGLGSGSMLAFIFLICWIGFFFSDYPLKDIYQRFKALLWFFICLGVFPVFFTPGTPVELTEGFFLPLTKEGVVSGFLSSLRLFVMFALSMILIRTTPPIDLVREVERICCKLPWESRKLKNILTVGLLAFQMIPLLYAEAENCLVTRWNRDRNLQKGGCFKKARKVAHLLGSLMVSVFARTERFTQALGLNSLENGSGRRVS